MGAVRDFGAGTPGPALDNAIAISLPWTWNGYTGTYFCANGYVLLTGKPILPGDADPAKDNWVYDPGPLDAILVNDSAAKPPEGLYVFWADTDNALDGNPAIKGTLPLDSLTKYGVDGTKAWFTWQDVGYYSDSYDFLNTFQVVMYPDGSFEFNYDKVQWDFSPLDEQGISALVGWKFTGPLSLIGDHWEAAQVEYTMTGSLVAGPIPGTAWATTNPTYGPFRDGQSQALISSSLSSTTGTPSVGPSAGVNGRYTWVVAASDTGPNVYASPATLARTRFDR